MTMIEPPHTEGMCLRQPATEPLYDVKSEEDIFYELSERLGVLDSYNDMVNMICGFDHSPNLMLERDKKYTDKEIARRKGSAVERQGSGLVHRARSCRHRTASSTSGTGHGKACDCCSTSRTCWCSATS
jgi:anaerobic selenocysteine-containing dehydrogenase